MMTAMSSLFQSLNYLDSLMKESASKMNPIQMPNYQSLFKTNPGDQKVNNTPQQEAEEYYVTVFLDAIYGIGTEPFESFLDFLDQIEREDLENNDGETPRTYLATERLYRAVLEKGGDVEFILRRGVLADLEKEIV